VENALVPANRKLVAWVERRGTVRVRKDILRYCLVDCFVLFCFVLGIEMRGIE